MRLRLADDDRDALLIWGATRAAVVVLVVAVTALLGGAARSFVGAWNQWDAALFVEVARYGYGDHHGHAHLEAFFPGEPLALRALHLVVRDWTAAGLLLSVVAGAVACVALARLARVEPGSGSGAVGRRAVLYFVLCPVAVFLVAGYSEAPFLALALPAWLCARRHRWGWAGLLAGAAAGFRITGVFLGAALIVQWLVDPGGRRRARDGAALLLPWLVTCAFFAYLHHVTGDWLAWSHAQQSGWGRTPTAPWSAFSTTWNAAFHENQPSDYAWAFRVEIVAVLLGLALTVVLAVRRRWAETVYVGGQVAALATSSYYLSVARATLLWWPLWLLLARWSTRHRVVHVAYLALVPAVMAAQVVGFTRGHWAG